MRDGSIFVLPSTAPTTVRLDRGSCGRKADYDRARVQPLSADGSVGVLVMHVAPRGTLLALGVEPRTVRIRYDDASLHHSIDRLLSATFEPPADEVTISLGDETLTLDRNLAADVSAALLRYVIELERRGRRRRPAWH